MTTEVIGVNYNSSVWYDISVFDSSMTLTIDTSEQSRILAEFSTSVYISNSAINFRVVVDNQFYSTISYSSSNPPMNLPVQVTLLTSALPAGQHTIEVQFYRDSDSYPTLRDRFLMVTELPSA